MTLLAPWFLLLLLGIPPLALAMARGRGLASESAARLHGLPAARPAARLLPRDRAALAALACMAVALSRPAWNPRVEPSDESAPDLVFAVDISRSMLAGDVAPSRLQAALVGIHETLDAIPGGRVGLVTFAGAATVRVPLTRDREFVRYLLGRVAPSDAAVGSTSLQAAIEKTLSALFREKGAAGGHLVILTDGEDHLSDIPATSALLRESGIRVLVVGLGNDIRGARVPAPGEAGGWMQFGGREVLSKLDEARLLSLASASPNVAYHKAGTRPFDLADLVARWLDGRAPGGAAPDGGGRRAYTEGYPIAAAAALALWLWPWLPRRRLAWAALLASVVAAGCAPAGRLDRAEFDRLWKLGEESEKAAGSIAPDDVEALLGGLTEAREHYLLAALLDPGNPPCAERITALTARLRELEAAAEERRKAERDREEELRAAIEALKALTPRQERLAQTGRDILRSKPPVPPAKRQEAAPPALEEQQAVRSGTGPAVRTIREHRDRIAGLLAKMPAADGATGAPEAKTEWDEPVRLLEAALAAQGAAVPALGAPEADWAAAGGAMFAAAAGMRNALAMLSSASPSEDPGQPGEEEPGESGEMEWAEDAGDARESMPMRGGSFQSALDAKSLPSPNYTAEEILAEEASNQQGRARRREAGAGANVEKNW
jgi:Mg-chelatase subunit ChlD